MVAKRDLTGQIFGRLTVLREAPQVPGKRIRWECLCVCGAVHTPLSSSLCKGGVRSCGCLVSDTSRARALRDGIGGYKGYAKYKSVADYLGNTKPNGDCMEWQGAIYRNGYAKFPENSRIASCIGHRAVYILHTGETPPVVRHTCDNRKCINPAHLIGGTTSDNIQDKISRGRDSHIRKLTADQVLQIRAAFLTGVSSPALGKTYSVSKQTILSIINRKIWNHI
jgi:hypothetical protein